MGDVCWRSHIKPKVCYKKYLGDSWTPEYRKTSTIISNHSSLLDPFTLMSIGLFSTYVMREDGVNPFLKPGIELINCVLVGEDKKAASKQIIEH
jgi:1-acyl-sn-glycerol-3-phosphate acyltransferase